MNRRPAFLVGALAPVISLTLVLPQPTAQAVSASARPAAEPVARATAGDPGAALRRLRAAADTPLRVRRGEDGQVEHLASSTGVAALPAPRGADSPAEAAAAQLDRYGDAFGLHGDSSRAAVRTTLRSATGGSVVRADQVVDGVPVFGGQLVLSLDADDGVVAVDADTSAATSIATGRVSEGRAARTARTAVAKWHRLPARDLTVSPVGRRLYDPSVVHVEDPRGARPVWQFDVADGRLVRETVLVGTERGDIALHFSTIDHLSRAVCDNNEDASIAEDDPDGVPRCDAPVRVENGAATGIQDVDQAYDNLGVVAQAYSQLNGTDLTALIGATPQGGTKSLMSTVRWCFTEPDPDPHPGQSDNCPYPNAFWDGQQMVFGQGYAGADDVVGHELTHGYVEHTAGLFALHQSGAINESVADTIGEVIDHRNPASPASDGAWLVGEDLPGAGALRSMKDPTLYDQPDRMRSSLFAAADFYQDGGAVHQNDGVGNKTAYLVSQGGSFNGQTITGIDAGDPSLAHTGLLYLETIKRLTSGAQYADLGLVLGSTCDQLVAANRGGFVAEDCVNVRKAVLATELAQEPLNDAAAPNSSVRCPSGYGPAVVSMTDDDATRDFSSTFGTLWQRTPDNDTGSWAHSGTSSWFGWDPDPAVGDPSASSALLGPVTLPDDDQARTLSFHHAYLLDYDGGSVFYDGAQVFVQTLDPTTMTWTSTSPTWISNGPRQTLQTSPVKAFGGDSRGYGTSVVDLRPYAGKTIRVQFKVLGDADTSLLGWFVDKIELQSCAQRVPGAPILNGSGANGAKVLIGWLPPDRVGSGITGYTVLGAGRVLATAGASDTLVELTPPDTRRRLDLVVTAHNTFGETSPPSSVASIFPTTATVTAPRSVKKKSKKNVTVSIRVRDATTGAPVEGSQYHVQQKVGQGGWFLLKEAVLPRTGVASARTRPGKGKTYLRVIVDGFDRHFGTISAIATITRKKR